jgi:hypothetical protein
MLVRLKNNLSQAQSRTQKYADLKRSERGFSMEDMMYLKLQPFRHTAFGVHQNLNLTTKYYTPFRVLEKIGTVAYMLQLPQSAKIHPSFMSAN